METNIIKGEALKNEIFKEIKIDIASLQQKHNKVPGIAFVGFMNVPLGKFNIPFHVGLAKELGFQVYNAVQPEGITEEELFKVIDQLNKDDDIHAIEILQPLPTYLNPLRIVNRVDPDKEVEGFHPAHMMENLFPDIQKARYPMCLPTALKELFKQNNIQVRQGAEWVLILDDEFFSNPLVNMVTRTALMKAVPVDSPLTIVNKNDENIVVYCKRADFLVVVTKDPESIRPEWLKPGVCIIDIYSNLVKEVPSKTDPDRLLPLVRGGVNVESVKNIAGAIFPIPGGLMSVVLAIMLRNVVSAFKYSMGDNYPN